MADIGIILKTNNTVINFKYIVVKISKKRRDNDPFYQFSKTFERTGLIDMPLKSDAVSDLVILPELPFNRGIA